jgi:hypothetical protein
MLLESGRTLAEYLARIANTSRFTKRRSAQKTELSHDMFSGVMAGWDRNP